ncbi:hypothetical protein JXB27_03490 [Candidatus Woesearchaeota archaeon]|nr:hypothetical protein [Candidatus Woesearchaeota archaeon]
MKINEIQAKQGDIDIDAEVVDKANPREFDKFGKKGRVCNAKIKDETGSVALTLWNDEIDLVDVGDKVRITKGYAGEWQGEIQLSAGKFGKIEIVEKVIPEKKVQSKQENQNQVPKQPNLNDYEDVEVDEENVF